MGPEENYLDNEQSPEIDEDGPFQMIISSSLPERNTGTINN